MTNKITDDLIKKLPKTDLHCHLDGSMRVSTILELAKEYKVQLPASDAASLSKMVIMGEKCESLVAYLKAFEITLKVLQWKDALKRVAYELIEDAAAENIKYIEVRYAPNLHLTKGLKLTQVVDAVAEGLKQGEKDFNVKSGIIICGIRNMPPVESLKLAELTVMYKDRGVVGFDLAGAEANNPAKEHKDSFYLVLNNNVNCTIHAGEAFGPESISQAIHYCGAHRIGHGTRLKENLDLMNYVNDHRIPLEICLTSNVQTNATESFETHPLRLYYDYGLRVTLNTDNTLVSGTTMTKELMLAVKHYNFDLYDIKNILIHGIKSAFLPYHEKVKILKNMIREIDRLCGFNPDCYDNKNA